MESENSLDRLCILNKRLPVTRVKDRDNPLKFYDSVQFKVRYHLYKDTAVFVVNMIKSDLVSKLKRGCQLPPLLQFFVAVRYFCTGSFQLVIGDYSKLSQSTISRIISRVSKQLAKLRPQFIIFPTFNEAKNIRDKFYNIGKFPGVVGAVDGCQIPIRSTGGENAELFRNRKGIFSINVQGVCDPDLNFTNIVAKWYGSVHDSRIFENSNLSIDMEANRIPGLLLGDSGYSLLPYLMTPLSAPTTCEEVRYNKSQIKTRCCIERTFGVWKRRFPCLNFLNLKLSTTLTGIIATAVLHNISRKRNDIFEENTTPNYGNSQDDLICSNISTLSGKAMQKLIITTNFRT